MSRSTVGASGKDTSNFRSDISHLHMPSSNEAPISSSDATVDEASVRAANRVATIERNEQRADKQSAGEVDVSDDEVFSDDLEPDLDGGEEPLVDDDEFSKLQGLSPDDFKIALNFSINCAAEAGYAAAIGSGGSTSKDSGLSSSKSSSTFNRHATVFKVVDETSGEEIPRQEILSCIWKLVQARVPLSLPCITTTTLQFIHNNPTSIKSTKSADGVSQSKELMLDMPAFGNPEDISQTDWHDTWINHLTIIKMTSKKDIYKYFKSHHHFILQQEDFSEEFEAYKCFDIWFCRHYTNTCFKLSQQHYQLKVLEFKLKYPCSHFLSNTPSLSAQPFPQCLNTRYNPYPRKSLTSTPPFPKGTTMNAPAGQCLICGRRGHKGSVCSYSHTEKGNPIASCWRNGCVILISSGVEVCFQWNVRSECKFNH
jgi:hypothetical protein